MALAEGGPGNWQPGSFPIPYQLGDRKPKEPEQPALPVRIVHAGPIELPTKPAG